MKSSQGVTINEEHFSGRSISIDNDVVMVDGKRAEITKSKLVKIVVHGDIEELTLGAGEVTANNVQKATVTTGELTCNTSNVASVTTGTLNVQGDVHGDATCKVGTVNIKKK
ncbi:hypothetical protein [Vibrio crassostreae]|uniref:hypothetical protein n=1 Tax=Vibrio crassostreae TaxID=246167 RepID=UPI001B307F9E|nr:hypothetical protein [Vibrio crassostreae]